MGWKWVINVFAGVCPFRVHTFTTSLLYYVIGFIFLSRFHIKNTLRAYFLPGISIEKPSISIKIRIILMENLRFRSKYQVFLIKSFEIVGFSHLEFEKY